MYRRFFEPGVVRRSDAFRPHVIGVVRDLARLDDATARARPATEERFLNSFPFHPDLTDAFYSRWTQLEGFQRNARHPAHAGDGAARGGALGYRAADRTGGPYWQRPVHPASPRRCASWPALPTSETATGARTDWSTLLEAELERARQIQDELPALRTGREAEQAVVTVFLHSQPIGRKAYTPELVRMAGSTAPDSIELEKGLRPLARDLLVPR